MNVNFTINHSVGRHRIFVLLLVILMTCIVLTILLDLLESGFQNSSFYLSEAVLFSSFWWLFLPLLFGQFAFANVHKPKTSYILLVLIPITIHLLAYPALVWLISKLLYYHTFSYWQTFNYELTKYSFILLIAYTVSLVLYTLFRIKFSNKQITATSSNQNNFVTTFVVADGNKRTNIDTKDILFFSAYPPYINIHHKTKRYLHNETLKSAFEN